MEEQTVLTIKHLPDGRRRFVWWDGEDYILEDRLEMERIQNEEELARSRAELKRYLKKKIVDWKPGERLIFNALDREWVEEIFCECLEELSTEHADSNEYMVKPFSDFFSQTCSQFEIIGIMTGAKSDTFVNGNDGRVKFFVNGVGVYARILIKRIVSA